MLIDTNILIDHLRGKEEAATFLFGLDDQPFISALTVAELFAGVKGKTERLQIHKLIEAFHVLPITTEIAEIGGLIKRKYHKSHGVGLADALIAGTSQENKISLATLNKKHFPMIKNIVVPY